MVKFYNEMPEMTFFAGDTLPIFTVTVNRNSLENCSMRMVVSRINPPKEAIIVKDCNKYPDCFQGHLQSSDTKNLQEGTYRISFIMTDNDGLEYIKLSGIMHVRSTARL